jgi:hypothetical protein
MNKTNWVAAAGSFVVVLTVFLVIVSLLGGWRYAGWGMMGPGMMGGWFGPFGWIGMIFMWLIPVGLVVLAAFGIALLVKVVGSSVAPVPSAQTCSHCGRVAQADWHTCPYCGQNLP